MYKILSLDGGGVWALAQARALAAIYGEDATGHEVLGRFDLAVANSGGSIVLGGLAADRRLSDIAGLFTDHDARYSMFQKTKHFYGLYRLFLKVAPKYDTAAKLVALQGLLPEIDRPMSQMAIPAQTPGQSVRLLVTGFDVDRQLAGFFRSQPVATPGWGHGAAAACTLVEAIHASSTPPVAYFDDPAVIGPTRLWDGGVGGYNNPVVAGVMEALAADEDPAEIRVLSIGTGTKRFLGPPGASGDFSEPRNDVGFPSGAISTLSGAILDDPPDVATFVAHGLVGGPPAVPPRRGLDSHVVRMSPMISPVAVDGQWAAPGGWAVADFLAFAQLQLDALTDDNVNQISDFVELWLGDQAMNQPVRLQADALTVEVGRGLFSEARADWAALTGD